MDNRFMCTAPVFVKRPACAWRGNFRTGGFGSRWSRADSGLGRVQDYPLRPFHLKKWRHFRAFVSRRNLLPHGRSRAQRLQHIGLGPPVVEPPQEVNDRSGSSFRHGHRLETPADAAPPSGYETRRCTTRDGRLAALVRDVAECMSLRARKTSTEPGN